jgi:acetolactate synthase-1/2/3 large subunit
VRAYCKRVFQPTRGDMVPLAIRQAWKTMVTGRQDRSCSMYRSTSSRRPRPPKRRSRRIGTPPSCRCGADPDEVAQALDMLRAPVRHPGRPRVKYGGAGADLCGCGCCSVAWSASSTGAIDSQHALALGSLRATAPTSQSRRAHRRCAACARRALRRPHVELVAARLFLHQLRYQAHPVDIDPDEIARNYPSRSA